MPKSKEYISGSDDDDGEKPKKKQKIKENIGSTSSGILDNKIPLGKNRFVTVNSFKGTNYVNIREYYDDNGMMKPGKKGIALSQEQWCKLKASYEKIDAQLNEL